MKFIFRVLPVVFLPITAQMPAGCLLYWGSSNLFSIGQTLLLRNPAVKRHFGIPEIPKVSWMMVGGGWESKTCKRPTVNVHDNPPSRVEGAGQRRAGEPLQAAAGPVRGAQENQGHRRRRDSPRGPPPAPAPAPVGRRRRRLCQAPRPPRDAPAAAVGGQEVRGIRGCSLGCDLGAPGRRGGEREGRGGAAGGIGVSYALLNGCGSGP